jgi:hypothetical protein
MICGLFFYGAVFRSTSIGGCRSLCGIELVDDEWTLAGSVIVPISGMSVLLVFHWNS